VLFIWAERKRKMKKILVSTMFLALFSSSVFAGCKFSEGDNFSESGTYLFGDSCTIYGTVETVNKQCTKAKVSVAKVTQAFGMAIDASCRYDGGEAATGDVVWISIK
jgi:hypothetical protein